jgi:hypothetical protein
MNGAQEDEIKLEYSGGDEAVQNFQENKQRLKLMGSYCHIIRKH